MTRWLLLSLAACAAPVDAAPSLAYLEDDGGACVCEDDGVPETWASGAQWYGEAADGLDPVMLGAWEDPGARVLHLGRGQAGPGYRTVLDLRLDADNLLSFMTNGRTRMKLHDHPSGYQILHLNEVPRLWFGNTLRQTAELHYQGTNAVIATSDYGELLSIRGQAMEAKASSSVAVGGDILLRAGDASQAAGVSVPLDPGELVLGGGKANAVTRGNVALHDAPVSWGGMEGGLYVRDAATVPTGTPVDGGFLYASGGALFWVGSSGNVTQVAAP